MARTSFFIDTTRCTGCRGCQTACKQWNQNPGTKTQQRGTYQNPADLSAATFKLVRFNEAKGPGGEPKWYFFPDQCRHCLYPPCKIAADGKAKGAVIIDVRTRAVIFNPAVKISPENFKEIREICPFDIPRYDEKSGRMAKCTMCFDRVSEGMLPACVKTCPTGAMNFGDRDDIRKMAANRLDEVRKIYKRASLVNPEAVRVIFLLADYPEKYHQFAAEDNAKGISRMMAIKCLVHPVAHLRDLMG
jgi:formate dehydrogenase iron-sulfur subunit